LNKHRGSTDRIDIEDGHVPEQEAFGQSDHSDYNPHKEDVKVDLERAYQLLRPMAENLGIILVPGIEIAEGNIHCNALFVKDGNALRGMKLIETLQRARMQEAYVFWNHPAGNRRRSGFL
jgi:hypothetical protein